MEETLTKTQIYGVILAGGRGRRMGDSNKPLMQLGRGKLIDQVISQAAPQVTTLCLSVNHDQWAYGYLGLPMVSDLEHAYAGPLNGIVSAMTWLIDKQGISETSGLLACFPADVPWFPADLVDRLQERMEQEHADLVLVEADGQLQPLFSLWRLSLLPRLQQAVDEGLFGPKLVLPRIDHALLKVQAANEKEFLNINTVDVLELARKLSSEA